MNVCSYHLQEAGATPVQEIAYALATAIGVLDAVRDSGQVDARALPGGVRLDLVLRQRRHPLRRGDLQDAGLHRAVGPHRARALRRHRSEGAPVPLRRAGQLASGSPRRSPRTTCSASCSRCSASRCRSGPGPARSSCRRGTRRSACPARGTSSGRCACSRCSRSRPTCSSTTTSSTARVVIEARTGRAGRRRAGPSSTTCSSLGGAFEAIDELKGRLVRSLTERTRRIESGEQIVVGVNRFTETDAVAARRRRERSSRSTPRVEAEMIADVAGLAVEPRQRRGRSARSTSCAAAAATDDERHAGHDRLRPRRRHDRRVGATCCARCSASTARRPASARPSGHRDGDLRDRWPSGSKRCPAARRGSSWPSRASTATRTAPSRSPSPPATPAWRSSTQGIRLTPEQIAAVGPRRGRRRHRPVDPVGQPPRARARGRSRCSRDEGVDAPVVVGGIIPEEDRPRLLEPASPPSTRRRTSSSAGSWTTSPTSGREATNREPMTTLRGAVRPGWALDSSQHAPMVLR